MNTKTGTVAEDLLEAMIGVKGYCVDRGVLVGVSIFGHRLKADLMVSGLPDFPRGLAIESKWQSSDGSVDEKFPYLVMNIRMAYPCPVIIILDGRGSKPGAVEWLKGQVDQEHLLAVLSC